MLSRADRRSLHSLANAVPPPEPAIDTLRSVCKVISESVSAGQIAEVRGQLPEEMKALFPATASLRQ